MGKKKKERARNFFLSSLPTITSDGANGNNIITKTLDIRFFFSFLMNEWVSEAVAWGRGVVVSFFLLSCFFFFLFLFFFSSFSFLPSETMMFGFRAKGT